MNDEIEKAEQAWQELCDAEGKETIEMATYSRDLFQMGFNAGIRAQAGDGCPYIETSGEGTNWCSLAEKNMGDYEGMRRALKDTARIGREAIPKGWKLVPVDPTPKMLEMAGTIYAYDDMQMDARPDYDHVTWWQAMLDAAPEPGERNDD